MIKTRLPFFLGLATTFTLLVLIEMGILTINSDFLYAQQKNGLTLINNSNETNVKIDPGNMLLIQKSDNSEVYGIFDEYKDGYIYLRQISKNDDILLGVEVKKIATIYAAKNIKNFRGYFKRNIKLVGFLSLGGGALMGAACASYGADAALFGFVFGAGSVALPGIPLSLIKSLIDASIAKGKANQYSISEYDYGWRIQN
tara:strand:+ start:4510 stop:5109 length:600 start_codon:yes stop_codon:yes gene_type:complete